MTHDFFMCRNCRKVRIDYGTGFTTPMTCEQCFGASWVYIMQEEPVREIRMVVAQVILRRVQNLRKSC